MAPRYHQWLWDDGGHGIRAGASLLARCDGSSDDATQIMNEDHCIFFSLSDPEPVLADHRLVASLERERASLEKVLQVARTQVARRGRDFANYVVDRMEDQPNSPERLRRIIGLIDSPEIPAGALARYIYLINSQKPWSRRSPSLDYRKNRALELSFIRVLFRIARRIEAPSLPGYLGNELARSIGINNAVPLRRVEYRWDGERRDPSSRPNCCKPIPFPTADNVFRRLPAERAAAVAWVRGLSGAPGIDPQLATLVLEWLEMKSTKKR